MKNRVTCLFVCLLACILFNGGFSALNGLDPYKAVTQYKLDIWQLERGFPQNTVFAVLQGSSGYIWIGTLEGLVRFDGVRFEVFNKDNVEQLKSNVVNALCQDREGRLWIGTEEGLSCLNQGVFSYYAPESGRRLHAISTIIQAKDGKIWIATRETGISCLQDVKTASFITFTTDSGLTGNEVHDILEDKSGNLWIATNSGLTKRTPDGMFSRYAGDERLANRRVFSLYETSKGDLWVGTQDGLYRLSTGTLDYYGAEEGLPKPMVLCMFEDKHGNLWGGTDGGGLFRITNFGTGISSLSPGDGLACGFIRAIHEDMAGNLWIGTLEGGLHRLRDTTFTNFTTKEGLVHDYVNFIYVDLAGNLRFATNGGVNLLKNGKLTLEFSSRQGLLSDAVNSILDDSRGNLWIGTGKGLHRFNSGMLTTFTRKDGLSDQRISNLLEDKQGTIWIATPRNLHRFLDGKPEPFSNKDKLFADNVWCLHEDHKGNIWVGTAGSGLYKLKGKKLIPFTTQNGPANNSVVCIYEDEEKNDGDLLYIGTEGGLSLLDLKTGKFTNITIQDGLIDNHVYCILGDDRGNLWLAGRAGVSCVPKKSLSDFAAGKSAQIHPLTFNEADGMKTRWCKDSAAKTPDGKLWFATDKGVVMIDPANIRKNTLPPPVVIEQIKVDGERIAYNTAGSNGKQRVVIPPGSDRVEFDYTALCFIKPAQTTFQIKMEGYDHDWIDRGNARSITYTGLKPGKYTFKVRACNSDGTWNETGDAFAFYLKPYIYQTTWFIVLASLLVALLAAAGIFSGYRLRVSRLKTREKKLSVLVEQRTRALNERTMELEKAHSNLRESKRIIEEKNLNITASIEYALKIQQAMLPGESTIKKALDDYFIIYKPRDIVSGDFYWFHRSRSIVYIAAVDCTGHGVPGAFLSMIAAKELNDLVGKQRTPDPAHLLHAMDRGVRKTLKQKKTEPRGGESMGMEAALCKIDAKKGILTFAGAKRPLYYVKNGEFFEIKGDKKTIGGHRKKGRLTFNDHQIGILPETTIYLTTDGFADQNNGKNKKFGSNRLKRFLHANAHLDMTQQGRLLAETLKKHQENEEQRDDITIIGIKMRGRGIERIKG